MVEIITKILDEAKVIENWNIDLVKINVTKREGIKYLVEELSDFDGDGILKTVKKIIELHTKDEKFNKYTDIQPYDSCSIFNTIYEMDCSNILVKESYDLFIEALAKANNESDPTKEKYDCYVLKSFVKSEEEEIPIKFIFMMNPVTTLKNKFIKIKEKYEEITDKVINLKLPIDVIIYGNKIYFFNNSGEKLFNMERAYKTVCQEKIEEINNADIISDIEDFKKVAISGHNPKKFISFNKENLELLKNNEIKESISQKFNIPLVDGKFNTKDEKSSNDLIKVLCGKGKIDPFNNKAVEVAGAKEWK